MNAKICHPTAYSCLPILTHTFWNNQSLFSWLLLLRGQDHHHLNNQSKDEGTKIAYYYDYCNEVNTSAQFCITYLSWFLTGCLLWMFCSMYGTNLLNFLYQSSSFALVKFKPVWECAKLRSKHSRKKNPKGQQSQTWILKKLYYRLWVGPEQKRMIWGKK